MVSMKGYIEGNTVVAIDDNLNDFTGNELLIHIVDKPKSQPVANERIEALKSIRGVLKDCKPITISEIREQRLSEKYGL
ncbi:MAG: hypothetical protein IK102_08645 [Treponema sp.]|nr:hypothetical protein [Treponema sp.]